LIGFTAESPASSKGDKGILKRWADKLDSADTDVVSCQEGGKFGQRLPPGADYYMQGGAEDRSLEHSRRLLHGRESATERAAFDQ
jgi:hypothetical protein